jgi:(p)ppGpp synthase/HD superfamily hydrolase
MVRNADVERMRQMDFGITAAMFTAKDAHKGQVRKYTGEPYVAHPFSVAGLVSSVTDDEEMVMAALLHDVVEDTAVKIEAIDGIFGERVASLVSDLTDISKPEDGNRKTRKAMDRAHTAEASNDAKTIKLADLIDNTKTIAAYDADFARVYMVEKKQLLEVLRDGDATLFAIANKMVEDYFSAF